MRARILFGLTLALLFIYGAHSATITVTNNCPSTIWLGDLTSAQQPQLSNTGFELASTSLNVPTPWNGRFWARTRCSIDGSGKFTCATTDCGSSQVSCNGNGAAPPTSLVEITITPSGRQDFYDINLVNGFNLPVSVAPQGGSGSCTAPSCAANVNAACPTELQVKTSYGSVISCKSARIEFNQPQYCCTGGYSTSTTYPPTNYSIFFKNQCPRAYSYAYDDAIRLFSCSGGPNYSITFLSLQ